MFFTLSGLIKQCLSVHRICYIVRFESALYVDGRDVQFETNITLELYISKFDKNDKKSQIFALHSLLLSFMIVLPHAQHPDTFKF